MYEQQILDLLSKKSHIAVVMCPWSRNWHSALQDELFEEGLRELKQAIRTCRKRVRNLT